MDESLLISTSINLVQQVKLFHWSTTSFAKHKALDELHDRLGTKIDMLVESFIGRNRKSGAQPKPFTIQLSMHSDASKIEKFLDGQRDVLQKMAAKLFGDKQPELMNIMHEIIADIDRAIYLCRLT